MLEMLDGYITIPTYVSLSHDHHDRIIACAKDLDLPVEEVLRAVINTAVRRHFDASSQEVPSDD